MSGAGTACSVVGLEKTTHSNSPSEVIRLTAMIYIRYPLSLRQVEDLLLERGIDICNEAVRFCWNPFGSMLAVKISVRRIHRNLNKHFFKVGIIQVQLTHGSMPLHSIFRVIRLGR